MVMAIRSIKQGIKSLLTEMYLKKLGVDFGENIRLNGIPIITKIDYTEIVIEKNVCISSNSKSTALGVNHPVVIRTLEKGAKIVIEENVGISGASICAAKYIRIGKNTLIGANSAIFDTNFHTLDIDNRRYCRDSDRIEKKEVVIEENVFIGTNVIVTMGVIIGRNSIIGAGSVVTNSIPANTIAAGNPCRVIRKVV